MSYQDFPPALLILSPRLTISGNPNASVVGISTIPLADGSFVYCLENRGEYQLDKQDNTTPPNGVTVLQPLTGPGRWKRLAVGGSGSIIQMGWDQVLKGHILTPATIYERVIDRDTSGNPLQVVLPNVTPGNVLRIGLTGNACNGDAVAHNFATAFVVSFDGSTVFPGAGFRVVNNSLFSIDAQPGNEAVLGGTNFVVIPDGATTATVQVTYDDSQSGQFLVFGVDIAGMEPCLNLEAWEVSRGTITQFGPTMLLP